MRPDWVIEDCQYALDLLAATDSSFLTEAKPSNDLRGSAAKKNMESAEVNEKATNIIVRALQAIGTAIKGIIDGIKDFFARVTMSGEEREAFDQFEQAIKDNPELANTKIEVMDFKQAQGVYQDLLNKVEQEYRAVQGDADHPIDQAVNEIRKALGDPIEATLVVLTADKAIKMCEDHPKLARVLDRTLKEDNDTTQRLEQDLGKKEFRRFKKNIQKAAKDSMLFRLKVNIKKRLYQTWMKSFMTNMHNIKVGLKLLSNDKTKDAGKAVVKGVAKGVGRSIKNQTVDKAAAKARKFVDGLDPDNDGEEKKSFRNAATGGRWLTKEEKKRKAEKEARTEEAQKKEVEALRERQRKAEEKRNMTTRQKVAKGLSSAANAFSNAVDKFSPDPESRRRRNDSDYKESGLLETTDDILVMLESMLDDDID